MEKIKQTKRLEDYTPGATRSEVIASLKKVLDMSKQATKEVRNGKTN